MNKTKPSTSAAVSSPIPAPGTDPDEVIRYLIGRLDKHRLVWHLSQDLRMDLEGDAPAGTPPDAEHRRQLEALDALTDWAMKIWSAEPRYGA